MTQHTDTPAKQCPFHEHQFEKTNRKATPTILIEECCVCGFEMEVDRS
jgi:hypothetical protein